MTHFDTITSCTKHQVRSHCNHDGYEGVFFALHLPSDLTPSDIQWLSVLSFSSKTEINNNQQLSCPIWCQLAFEVSTMHKHDSADA